MSLLTFSLSPPPLPLEFYFLSEGSLPRSLSPGACKIVANGFKATCVLTFSKKREDLSHCFLGDLIVTDWPDICYTPILEAMLVNRGWDGLI